MDRAHGLLHIKALDDDARTLRGIATTPAPDRHGDIIEPLGVKFVNPLPLLLFHDTERPVGFAQFAKATAEGIAFTATIPRIQEPGALQQRVDEAWQTVKAGLISGVSIGFRPVEFSMMKDGGMHFLETEVVELSLVAIPANSAATILAVKALDQAASGPGHPPGVPGRPVVHARKDAPAMTTAEQITQWSNTRAPKAARIAELMAKSAESGTTLDDAQSTEFDALESEVKSIDLQLTRLRTAESLQVATATPVVARTPAEASAVRSGSPIITVKSTLPKGTAFIRACQAIAVAKGSRMEAADYARRTWGDTTPEVELYLKAATAPGTTTDATWAGPLAPLKALTDEFLDLLRPATVIDRIPGLRNVPFNISIASQTGGGTYQWVGQGAPKPVGKLQFGTATLGITKCAGIIVITEELARTSTPSAEATIRNDMIKGIAAFLDAEFTDPTKAAVANVSPGSVTNGVTPLTTAGTTPANARTDMLALLSALTAAGFSAGDAVLLLSEANAMALSFALNPLGQPLYPTLGPTGGTAMGVTVIASKTLGTTVIALDPNSILYADDGGVTIDASREASVQMDTAPMNPPDATVVLTSFWQQNLVGLRAERFINWKKARTGCVQYLVATYAGA